MHGLTSNAKQFGCEGGMQLEYAPADKSAYVFVVGRRLKMNGTDLRPLEDTIGQPMLQIPE